jgi:hypothetical protein
MWPGPGHHENASGGHLPGPDLMTTLKKSCHQEQGERDSLDSLRPSKCVGQPGVRATPVTPALTPEAEAGESRVRTLTQKKRAGRG